MSASSANISALESARFPRMSDTDAYIVHAKTSADLPSALGSVGAKGGPRTGPNARTHLDKELWCLRRYLLSKKDDLDYPLVVEKSERPDFVCVSGQLVWGIEVSEATHPDDQREYTLLERSEKPCIAHGEFGGRFAGGAHGRQAEEAWQGDILRAVTAKSDRMRSWDDRCSDFILLLYATGNAQMLFDFEDEFDALHPLNAQVWCVAEGSRIRAVEIICGEWLLSLRATEIAFRKLRS